MPAVSPFLRKPLRIFKSDCRQIHSYGKGAHFILSREKLASQLLYYGKVGVQEGDASYGHLKMVGLFQRQDL